MTSRWSSTSARRPIDAVGYILAQIIGAIGAAAVICVTVSQDAVTAGITKPGAGITDISALILETVFTAIFLVVILTASKRAGALAGAGHPADARRDPLRHRDADRLVGQPGPLDRLGARRRRPDRPVDLPRRPDRRRHHRLGHLPGDGATGEEPAA